MSVSFLNGTKETKRELAAIERARPKWWDFRQYLPGYATEAERLLEQARMFERTGIHPSHVDLWTRISQKFAEKCRLGELLDCR